MAQTLNPRRLRVNRSFLTVRAGLAGLPLHEMWTHMLAAERYAVTKHKLPKCSSYDKLCTMSDSGGRAHQGGKALFAVLDSVKKHGVKEPISVYVLGQDEYEIYGGHHRAIAALLNHKPLPFVCRSIDPVCRSPGERFGDVRRAYAEVESHERLAKGRSYNPCPGRKAIRCGRDRLQMMYRALVDVPGTQLLDAGCNDGYFGVALSDHGFLPTFLDQSGPYLDVVKAKAKACGIKAKFIHGTIAAISPLSLTRFTVVLYTDVFYHAATKQSLDAALQDWRKLLRMTTHRMIFCPGRWDKLTKAGFTEELMWEEAQDAGFRVRYLGCDEDLKYQRPLFCLERIC